MPPLAACGRESRSRPVATVHPYRHVRFFSPPAGAPFTGSGRRLLTGLRSFGHAAAMAGGGCVDGPPLVLGGTSPDARLEA